MKRIGPYTKEVLKHFQRPHNMGKIKNPDGLGKAGNIVCGDIMHLYLKVGKDKKGREVVKDIKFETYGCLAAIASSSVITDLVKGKTIKEALRIDRQKVVKTLGGLPPIKRHCSVLATDALLEAIHDYLKKNKKPIPKELCLRHKRIEKEKKEIGKRYSVCRRITGNPEQDEKIICPCVYAPREIEEQGHCFCGLFVKQNFNFLNNQKVAKLAIF